MESFFSLKLNAAVFLVFASAGFIPAEEPRLIRTPPPRWDSLPRHVFFEDAFAEALIGERPAVLGGVGSANGAESAPRAAGGQMASQPATGVRWSSVISRDALEDAVKLLQISLESQITTPTRFSSGGYQRVRHEFNELAMLFAVISQYDGEVRWKADAAKARELFARAAANAKVSSIQAFNEAKRRKDDLKELVRGGTLQSPTPADSIVAWNEVSDRRPLMARLESRFEDRVRPWTANANVFKSQLVDVRREGELLKLVAVVLRQEGMEDADDATYAEYCEQFEAAANSLLQAIDQRDHPAASNATSELRKSCDQCHEDYRG